MSDARSPGKLLPERIESVRRRREWTQQQLADAMNTWGNGAKMDRSTIAKIESKKRAVTVDEVFWFAAALGVSPLALLLPRGDEPVQVAPGSVVRSSDTVQWYRGFKTLVGDEERGDEVRFFEEQRPDYEVTAARRLPGVLQLVADAELVVALVGQVAPLGEKTHGLTAYEVASYWLDRVADEAQRLRKELMDACRRDRDERAAAAASPATPGRKRP